MKIKIQSISDVITNSSTEVYITYYSCDKKAIIKVIDSILSMVNGGKFEDYFEFEWIPNEDYLYNKWENEDIEIPFEEWMKTLSEDALFESYQSGWYDEDRNYVQGYIIKAKDPENVETASLLSSLDSIFQYKMYVDW